MEELISYCGLICQGCPIYWATREQDQGKKNKMRVEIARQCAELGTPFDVEDITDCDGCKAESGRLFSSCTECKIRACARHRRVDNCAHCPDYRCEKLDQLDDVDAKSRLDLIKASL